MKQLVAFLSLSIVFVAPAVASVRGGSLEDPPRVTGDADAVWTAAPSELDAATLNPRGDRYGDGRPHIAQSPAGSWWAVWSLADRGERDIAISHYDGVSWSPFELIEADNGRQDLDPRIGFLADGSPVVVWWQAGTKADRNPRVVGTYWTPIGWTAVEALSSEPAWRPGILMIDDVLTVAWETADGIAIERFHFQAEDGTHGMPSDPAPFPGHQRRPPDDDEDLDDLRSDPGPNDPGPAE